MRAKEQKMGQLQSDSPGEHSWRRTGILKIQPATALQWLLFLAILYTLYFAQSLLIPIVVALFLALLLNPLVTYLKEYFIPRTVSALFLLVGMASVLALLGSEFAGPVQKWAQAIPALSQQITEQIDSISDSIQSESASGAEAEADAGNGFFNFFRGNADVITQESAPVETNGTAMIEQLRQGGLELAVYLLGATPFAVMQILSVLILILFLLIFGPNLFKLLISNSNLIHDKTATIELVTTIKRSLSYYVFTVSTINAGLGLCTAAALWLLGVDDPLLWGVLVGLLNYAPYLGAFVGICLLSLAGIAQFGAVWTALIPAGVYLALNMTEAQFITPLLMGKHMRLNPLILIVWLLFWGWLWGALGVLLAVPLLVCAKLIIVQLKASPQWVKLIESQG